jgi:Peptidase family M1 domain
VTKVLGKRQVLRTAVFCLALCAWPVLGTCAQFPAAKAAEALYLELGKVGLDPARVYQVRGASLDRSSIQISLEDGTIAFTRDVMGRISGAFFQGDGEILLTPPNAVERKSMSFFTGMPILEERFETAYFRFNDDAFEQLRPDLRDTNDKQEFVQRWDSTAKNLANGDAIRLLVSFSQMLPVKGIAGPGTSAPGASAADRFLHARLQGAKLGIFDVFFDSTMAEQVQAGQARNADNGGMYYDVWTSFAPLQTKGLTAAAGGPEAKKEKTHAGRITIRGYTVRTEVLPPKQIRARAHLQCDVREGGSRTLLFELSRFLQIESVTLDGNPVEFIHNPAIEGTQPSRRGNDIVAVVLPEPARSGQKFELDFAYAGEVLAEAGSGLLYVGERGTWYPNRGMEMANFDLQFTYPQGWTLVATGKPTEVVPDPGSSGEGQTSRWVSERPIPLAGFNLGKYREATTRVGEVTVRTYATVGVERNFPSGQIEVIEPIERDPERRRQEVIMPANPSPARNEVLVGEAAARAIQYFSDRFGPFPYSHLALTQMPGNESQGWPGLIFLSSYAFLTDEERKQLQYEEPRILLQHLLPAHETAHQWWGDLVTWSSYRDQWFSEGLAHYCALMMLQEKNPEGFRELMENYRHELVEKNKDGLSPMDAGPVTLGTRLLSSRSPLGYEAINYGRGAWLFHMLRTMLKDGAQESARGAQAAAGGEEPFVRALRKLRQQYEGKAITTTELLEVFAEELPPSLWYEGKRSLDWFLEGWINGTSLPKLELRGVRFSPRGTGFVVSGTILQKGAPQELVTSVPLYGVRAGKQPMLLGRVFADGDESPFRLSAPAGTRKILIDPYGTLLTAPKQ